MTDYALLFGVGLVAGALNVIAGGGSFLTLPILIFLGLPATVANGTNRVGIFLQNVAAVWGFNRHKVMDWRYVLWAAVPATFGAGLGTWAAVSIGDAAFRRVLAFLMIAVTLWTLWDPLRKHRAFLNPGDRPRVGWLAAGFFVVGIYGGFVQAGVGFLILATTTLAGLDLVRGNAVKVLSVLVYTALSLGLFAWQDKVVWDLGLALAVGTVAGSQVGVRLTVLKGHGWVKGVVTVAVVVFAVKLLLMG
ncbi:sulfite exporter TauE/SafE family protein [Deferrisoma camini]|uniref:sulfite exporter TauE/SafE family protein n=1 Tax=Deferrisoma camini TaxID=1035120 RepID=UPI00046D8A42|nr:sulfite exporter TauE/SafE family protein [Deferrisoma camini]